MVSRLEKPARKLPSWGSCSEALKQGMRWSGEVLPYSLLALPILPTFSAYFLSIFHSFNKYHLSPTMCRHAINMDTPVPFSLFPIFSLSFPPFSILLNLSFLASPTSLSCYFSSWNSGVKLLPIFSPGAGAGRQGAGSQGAAQISWRRLQGAVRAQSEHYCGLETKKCPQPPTHPG